MSEKRYLDESSVTTFAATVEDVGPDGVVLDQTYFYPTGGGQPHDTGVLRDAEAGAEGTEWRVVDVTGRETVHHAVEGDAEPPAPGTTVTGEIDAERRRAHSRYHTAQHVLSAVLLTEFDAETTGNQLYADRARLDCAHERFTDSDLAALEAAVNDVLGADHDVDWYTLDRETAEDRLDTERTRLDLLPDSVTEVRIVDIGDGEVDRTACAGTHVENTGDVGQFVVTGRETAGSGEERIRFELRAP